MSQEYINYMNNSEKTSDIIDWPNFSLRPSLIRVSALKKIGLFSNGFDFEKQYAIEYTTNGYKTAFFDTVCYIGKEITPQISRDEKELIVKILSRNETINQWNTFKENAINKIKSFSRHIPRHIIKLNKYEKQIFTGNKFNYDRKIIDEIMYYLDLFKNNSSENMMILRDNIVLDKTFDVILNKLMKFIKNNKYDVILLKYLDEYDNLKLFENNNNIDFIAQNGFIVSKSGCQKIIANIKKIMNYDDINKLFHNDDLKIYAFTDKFYTINPGYTFVPNIDHNVEIEGYTYYSQMDSFGNDNGYYGDVGIEKLKQLCEEKNCTGFNTLGWIKHHIDPEEKFIYLLNSHEYKQGLYVKNKIKEF